MSRSRKAPRLLQLDEPHRVIDHITAAFDDALAASLRERARDLNVEEVSLLAQARELFLCGGAAMLERLTKKRQWLQVGVRFTSDDERRRFLDRELADRVERWLEDGLISDFFFMNKAPGVRLRFCGHRVHEGLQPRVFALLAGRKRRGRLIDYELGLYDGETYQFGGLAGLELFHSFSTFDSLAVLRLHELRRRGALRSQFQLLSLLLLIPLMRALTSDDWELWDVWCNMRLTGRELVLGETALRAARHSLETQRKTLEEAIFAPERCIARLSRAEQRIIRDYHARIEPWAISVQAAIRGGALLYGIRKILPFYVIFHWNRLDFTWRTQCSLTFYMQHLLDPKALRTGRQT